MKEVNDLNRHLRKTIGMLLCISILLLSSCGGKGAVSSIDDSDVTQSDSSAAEIALANAIDASQNNTQSNSSVAETTATNTNASQSQNSTQGDKQGDKGNTAAPTNGTSDQAQPDSKPELLSGSDLHITGNGHNIGDVHPYYEPSSKKWYMFYLVNESNKFIPKLMTSTDMIKWTPQTLNHTGYSSRQPYYVLGVWKLGSTYFSYYGNGGTMEASESNDLLSWKNNSSICIPNDMDTFPSTSRDPYLFFDPDTNTYRCISSAYRTNQEWSMGSGIDVSLAVASTTGNDLESWTGSQKELIHFSNGYKGEPECPQMFKIGSRWYILTSLARRTNNYVGLPSYWVGDSGSGIDNVSWASKQEMVLDGEDLCAAQVVSDGSRSRMWGWIPKGASGGTWGGHLNLPREVYQQSDGTLSVKLDTEVGKKIRGRQLTQLGASTLSSGGEATFSGVYNRLDMDLKLRLNSSASWITAGDMGIKIDAVNNEIKITKEINGVVYSSLKVPAGVLNGEVNIRVIAESDIVEVFVNDRFSLCGRIGSKLSNATVKIVSAGGTTDITSAALYKLKFLEEI